MRCEHDGMTQCDVSMAGVFPFWVNNRNDNRNSEWGRRGLPGSGARDAVGSLGWRCVGGVMGADFTAFGRLSVLGDWDWFDFWGHTWREGNGWGLRWDVRRCCCWVVVVVVVVVDNDLVVVV